MIAEGTRVRHRKQAAWGIGTVTSTKVGPLVELVIQFGDSERTLKLKPEIIETMIEVLSMEESTAIDAAAAVEAKVRAKQMKAKKLEPKARITGDCLELATTQDGLVMLALNDEGVLRVCQPDGHVVEDIAMPTFSRHGLHFVPTRLVSDGQGLFVGTRSSEWNQLVFVRPGKRAQHWHSPLDLGVTHAVIQPGVGAVVTDLSHVLLVGEDGSTRQLPLSLGGRNVDGAQVWHDGVLVGSFGEDGTGPFRYLYLSHDGTVRHEGVGSSPTVLDDRLMLTFDRDGVLARTRDGTLTGRLAMPVFWDKDAKTPPFVRIDEELVFSLRHETGLVRWHPEVDQPRWVAKFEHDKEGLSAPVRVGRFIAATYSAFAKHQTPKVWLVEAETGALVHTFEIKAPVRRLIAAGDDALVAISETKQVVAWRNLSTVPERVALSLAGKCIDAVSPAAGAVVLNEGEKGVSFFEL
jgi:hypothetical protein